MAFLVLGIRTPHVYDPPIHFFLFFELPTANGNRGGMDYVMALADAGWVVLAFRMGLFVFVLGMGNFSS